MQDNSTPSPSDPDQPDSGSATPPKESSRRGNPLRLKRIVIEESEISPGDGMDWTSTPESPPYAEDEEAAAPLAPDPLNPEQTGTPSPETGPDDFDDADIDEEETVAEKKKLSPTTRLALIVVPALVLFAAMIFGIRTFDPFGEDLAPIAPAAVPDSLLKKEPRPKEAIPRDDSGLAGTPLEVGRTSLQNFLNALQEQPLTASTSPRGVFVDSVFIPEGMPLDKQAGVIFSGLEIEGNQAYIVVTSPDGTKLTLPADYISN